MSKEIVKYVKHCNVCVKHKGEQQKETLFPHEVPSRPWEKVVTVLFHSDGRQYLLTVAYYSDFFEVDRLETAKASEVIRKLKGHFARYGIPQVLTSDNGPPYDSQQFEVFIQRYDSEHYNSSPAYAQSNGKSENAVKQAVT